MKKLSQLSDKGLLKREKACLIGQIASLAVCVTGIAFVFASLGIGTADNSAIPQILTTAGVGVGLGAIGAIGTNICIKTDEKISAEKIRRKEYEGFVPYIEEDEAEME